MRWSKFWNIGNEDEAMNIWSNGPVIQLPRHCGNRSQTLPVQQKFFKNIKNVTNSRQHAVLWEVKIYSKSPPTNPIPWNDLEKCLKIECLMKDMHKEYSYMFRPYQHFWYPTPLTLYQVLAELKSTRHWLTALQLTIESMPATCTHTHTRPFSPPYYYESSSSESLVLTQQTPFPIYMNSDHYSARLLSHSGRWRNFWWTHGNHRTPPKFSKPIQNDTTFVAHYSATSTRGW
jgi:hypothetical protein